MEFKVSVRDAPDHRPAGLRRRCRLAVAAGLAAGAAGLACPAVAQGGYVGVDLARARLGEAPAHWAGPPSQAESRDNGMALALGYRFGGRWSAELGLRRLGQAQWTGQPPWGCAPGLICTAVMPPAEVVRLRSTLGQVSLLAQQPLGAGVALRGRVGLAYLHSRVHTLVDSRGLAGGGATVLVEPSRRSEHRVAPWLGAGLHWTLGPRWALVGELQTAIGPGATRPTLLSLGAEFGY